MFLVARQFQFRFFFKHELVLEEKLKQKIVLESVSFLEEAASKAIFKYVQRLTNFLFQILDYS